MHRLLALAVSSRHGEGADVVLDARPERRDEVGQRKVRVLPVTRELLSQLQDMLENLRTARPGEMRQRGSGEAGRHEQRDANANRSAN